MRPSEITALLQSRGFLFRKSLGQNFLLDPNLLEAVANAGEVGPGDLVVEVGTGAGTLTSVLARRAARVVTLELDERLGEIAREVVGERGNVRYVAGDALRGESGLHPAIEAALGEAAAQGLRGLCVSNFPYNIATPLFVRLLERAVVERAFPLARIAGMVQREVADRLTAMELMRKQERVEDRIGKRDFGVPSVLAQTLAAVRLERKVSPAAFFPRPKVDSAVIVIEPRPGPALAGGGDYGRFRDLVRAVFRYRRKTVKNALELGLGLDAAAAAKALAEAGIDPKARVEALSVAPLQYLANALPTLP